MSKPSKLISNRFKVGQRIRCIQKPTRLTHLHLRIGDEFIVTAVDSGVYSDLLNIRKPECEESMLRSPLLPSIHFSSLDE